MSQSTTAAGWELHGSPTITYDAAKGDDQDMDLAGKTNAEIATAQGKSPDAIRMSWNRARQKLIERGLISPPGV